MKVNKVTNAWRCGPSRSEGEEEKKNLTPATHALPPSLNYHRRVAHTAGDDEGKNRLKRERGKRKRERREWRIIASRTHKVAGPRWLGLKGPLCTIRAQPRPRERVRPSCCNNPPPPLPPLAPLPLPPLHPHHPALPSHLSTTTPSLHHMQWRQGERDWGAVRMVAGWRRTRADELLLNPSQ